jgi:predicted NBD/HSP70 family sugar kinase
VAILGVDIGGTSVKAAAWDDGRFSWTGQSPFYSRPTASQLHEAIRAAVANRIEFLSAVGLCVPGLFDPATRQITVAINVPGLVEISLDRLVPQALNLTLDQPATIVNDAAAAALDIFTSRKLRGRLLVLSLGTGVGAAVLDDGRPLRVEGESPGHLGQIDVSVSGHDVIGPDGGAGGLEGYIGAAALRKQYGGDVSASLAKFTGEEIPIQALVRAIRIAHAVYRPNHICLCGGIGIRLRHLLPVIRQKTEKNLTSLARPKWNLSTGDDDFHAARGAALSAQDARAQS